MLVMVLCSQHQLLHQYQIGYCVTLNTLSAGTQKYLVLIICTEIFLKFIMSSKQNLYKKAMRNKNNFLTQFKYPIILFVCKASVTEAKNHHVAEI